MRPGRPVDAGSRVQDGTGRKPGADPQRFEEPLSELQVLQAISRAFGSSTDFEEASTAARRWVRAAVGAEPVTVRLFLDDPKRGLYSVLPRIEAADDPDRRGTRREILARRRPVRSPLSGGRALVTMPLISRGEPVGVLEFVAPAEAVEERWATLEAVASQVAIVLRNIVHRTLLTSGFEGLKEASALAGEMVRTRTPQEAVRAAVSFCHRRFGRPAAGWLAGSDVNRLELVSARGLGSTRGARLRSRVRTIARADLGSEEGRARLAERFAEAAGVQGAETVAAGDALLLVGGPAPGASFRMIETLLEDLLGHLAVVAAAEQRTEQLDLGIALTAHEVRGPLVGALAMIERLLMDRQEGEEDHELLRRSREQLQQLAGLVDGMLRWAVAGEPLDLRPTDLDSLVRQAVEASGTELGTDRVAVTAHGPLMVRADADHLRAALTNVVRNALIYSPSGTRVSVDVGVQDGLATVTVRDRGPGVPAAEREFIFDPFMRGSAAHLVRSGNGLGLFITRRVMEAHGGRVWLGSAAKGANFHLQLPLAEGY
jgi:signal transduction histidine kinase